MTAGDKMLAWIDKHATVDLTDWQRELIRLCFEAKHGGFQVRVPVLRQRGYHDRSMIAALLWAYDRHHPGQLPINGAVYRARSRRRTRRTR